MNVPSYEEHMEHGRQIEALWTELRITQQLLPRMLNTDQVCQAIGRSRARVKQLVKEGKLMPTYIGAKPLFAVEDIRAYIESRRVSTGLAGQMVTSVLNS